MPLKKFDGYHEIKELKELLRWALEEIESYGPSRVLQEETPAHDCGYVYQPDSGFCIFHENYWRAKHILEDI